MWRWYSVEYEDLNISVAQIPSIKYQIITKYEIQIAEEKIFDLEKRTFGFTKNVALFCKELPKITSNFEYAKQVIRSSGSVGANYIEANEALSKKDFVMRIKISRKGS